MTAAPIHGQRFSMWSAPANLKTVVNSPQGDFFPAIAKDGLSLYFTSSRPNPRWLTANWDIYVCTRASVDEPWGPPQDLGPNINTSSDEGAPSFSPDGHLMYFASTRPGGFGGNDIYVSRRHDKRDDVGWEVPDNIGGGTDGVNSAANEASPIVFEDPRTGEMTLYFDSNRPGGLGPFGGDAANNGGDIYTSTRRRDGTFGPAAIVAELSTSVIERQPSISRNGLEMFISSDRPGSAALDLWVWTRESTSDPWELPVNLSAVNSAGVEAGPHLSFDGTTLYFQSNRPGSGAFDLFAATRTKLTERDRH
jgi:Tol biopolymer transport system component